MKKRMNILKTGLMVLVFMMGLSMESCEEYLDKAPEANITMADAFNNFVSAQGFVEELYCCIVNPAMVAWQTDFHYADEFVMNITWMPGTNFDNGDYWIWQNARSYFKASGTNTSPTDPKSKGIWGLSWYGIRKCNLGLENVDKMINATQEERDIIKGQLLFFRGYFYHELMIAWGGMPYIDKVLQPTEEMKLSRLNYRETALKANADFKAAAELLPLKWDETEPGKRTIGANRQRISKATALAYQGRNLLYAASPLMNRESSGKAEFDVELAKMAADALSKVIALCEGPNPPYKLQPWNTYTDMFFMVTPNRTIPGGTEVMLSPLVMDRDNMKAANIYQPGQVGYNGMQICLTNSYTKNWGMANGLPITDPASGYKEADPWVNRDPRFYKTIVVDGDQMCISTAAGKDRFAQFNTGGYHRVGNNVNVTGFCTNKYGDSRVNRYDNPGNKYQFMIPLMRLTDVYLMYAESVLHGFGTAKSSVPGSITAEEAINRIRNRATLPNIDAKYTTSKDLFMEEIIRERAVELSFERQRWYDLRRWMIAGQTKYKVKTALEFDRAANGKPINMVEKVLVTRVFEDKHYWLPLPVNQVTLYPEFKQNPGW